MAAANVLAGPIQVQTHHTMSTISSEGWSGQIAFEPVERCRPAGTVAVARGLVEELLVLEREQRAVAVGSQRDRHQRLPLRHGAPHPREDQLAVRNHLAIGSADVRFRVVGCTKAGAEVAADAWIWLCAQRVCLRGAPPVHYLLRVGPGAVDFLRWRAEPALDDEAGFGGHESSRTRSVGSGEPNSFAR